MDKLKKYDSILKQIEHEHAENSRLKEAVQQQNNRLIAVRLATDNSINTTKYFHLKIKVFDSIFDLFNLYQEEISLGVFENLQNRKNSLFYLIELYVGKPLEQIISSQEWLLNFRIQNSENTVQKNVRVQKGQFSSPYLTVIPFDDSIEEAMVTAQLFLITDTKWTEILLSKKIIEFSYHIKPYKAQRENEIVSITKLYKPDLRVINKQLNLEYTFNCKCTLSHFFETIAKNSYHRFDSKLFSAFTSKKSDNNDVSLLLNIGNNAGVTIRLKNDCLTIDAPPKELYKLKLLLINQIRSEEIFADKSSLLQLKNLSFYTRQLFLEEETNVETAKMLYSEINEVVFNLPI